VIGFCPDDRASQVINSITTYTKWINLYFYEGNNLPDPEGLLEGSGAAVRDIRITDASERPRSAGDQGADGSGARCRRSAAQCEGEAACYNPPVSLNADLRVRNTL
jgi:hypothetical protein